MAKGYKVKDLIAGHWHQPVTTQDFHVVNVYKDPEFIADVAQAYPEQVEWIERTWKSGGRMTSTDFAKRNKMFINIEKMKNKPLMNLCEKYLISPYDLKLYLMGRHRSGKNYRVYKQRRPFEVKHIKGHQWAVLFNLDITREEFDDIWPRIKHFKKLRYVGKIPQPKSAEKDKLLYAVFKALGRNEKFPVIAKKLSEGKLEYYKGELAYDYNSLRRYYNSYGPKKQKSGRIDPPSK